VCRRLLRWGAEEDKKSSKLNSTGQSSEDVNIARNMISTRT